MSSRSWLSVGSPPSAPVWSPDSKRLAFLWAEEGTPLRDVWIADPAAQSSWRASDLAAVDEFAPAQTAAAAADGGAVGATEVTWTASGDALVLGTGRAVYESGTDRAAPRELVGAGPDKASLQISPDDRLVSFLQAGDLWLLERATGVLSQATFMGVPAIGEVPGARYFRPDVEFSSYVWSPDSRFIAMHLDDRRDVRKVLLPTYLQGGVQAQYVRRPFAADNDQVRAIAIYRRQTRDVAIVELPESTRRRISSFKWAPDSGALLVDQSSQSAEHRWLYAVNPHDASYVELYHEHRPRRTTAYWTSTWRSDGQAILLTAELTGRHHLYSLGLSDGRLEPLTDGDWDILASVRSPGSLIPSTALREVFFVATKESPHERHVYRIPESGGRVVKLTSKPGTHTPFPSPDGQRLAVLHSGDLTPTELHILDTGDGGANVQRIAGSGLSDTAAHWVQPRYVTFPSQADGATLHARLLIPAAGSDVRGAPVVLGPVYHDTVRDEWRGVTSLIQQHFVECGYAVLQVDVRGSTGYGRDFIEKLALDYGGIDVEDLESAVHYLRTLPGVDSDRIGIWGSSYGGLLVMMSLFKKPGVYKAGVAAAPASNLWHARPDEVANAGRPEEHPDVYARSSAINFCENLADHLMIIHGMRDDVVLFEDSVALAEKLIALGKRFDLVVAPGSGHALWEKASYATYLASKLVGHFERHLGAGSS